MNALLDAGSNVTGINEDVRKNLKLQFSRNSKVRITQLALEKNLGSRDIHPENQKIAKEHSIHATQRSATFSDATEILMLLEISRTSSSLMHRFRTNCAFTKEMFFSDLVGTTDCSCYSAV